MNQRMEKCPVCGNDIPSGTERCPVCGYAVQQREAGVETVPPELPPEAAPYNPVYMQQPSRGTVSTPPVPLPYIARYTTGDKKRRYAGTFGAFSSLGLLFLLIVSLVYLLWSPSVVIPNGMSYGAKIFILTPAPTAILTVTGWGFVAYYLGIVAAITISFFYVLFKDWKIYAKELNMRWKEGEHSIFFTVSAVFFAVLFFDRAYIFFITLIQITPTTPDFSGAPIWEIMYSLANASVWEEVITRILLLGIPLLLYHTVKRERRYPVIRYITGGGIEMDNGVIVLIILSSSVFGIAHLFSWDIYKIIPATVGGIAFAYIFLKYGLAASIILHFTFDFTIIPTMWSDNFAMLYVAIMILSFIAGAIFFVYYLKKIIDFIDVRFGLAPEPAPSSHTSGGPYYISHPQYFYPNPLQQYPNYSYPNYGNQPGYAAHPLDMSSPPPTRPYQSVQPQYGQYPPQYPAYAQSPQHQQQSMDSSQSGDIKQPLYAPHYAQQASGHPSHLNNRPGPVPDRTPDRGFICPVCGYTEARYENGVLVCLRCGHRTVL